MFYGQADQISKGFKNSIVGEEKTVFLFPRPGKYN